ncbi:putative Heme-transporting ATPase [Candidatus Sulfotelmatobacter kueseliae]|uniref:Putative Heme-transporting ATPase n=1 Tax=Candidatus Sulfotelmatobacter kueseliae TaxID=2042962 RepID=A0A2U3K7N3_9BACT|nr:putative Heme-transporting ATPase [Candidatus Sulfotelmatobacter kueseliae]
MNDSAIPTIAVHNVIKQFGRFAALRGVTAEFDAGRFHAILGDNGAGKTTLLRALAGLAQPTRGEISIFGKTPKAACRDIGYMAHPSLLYDEMSGMENLRYFAGLYGIACSDRNKDNRCAEVTRAVGLDPELTRPVGQYSQRRAVFARDAPAHVAGAGHSARSQSSVARRALLQRGRALGPRDGQPAQGHARRRQDDFRRDPPGPAARRCGRRIRLDAGGANRRSDGEHRAPGVSFMSILLHAKGIMERRMPPSAEPLPEKMPAARAPRTRASGAPPASRVLGNFRLQIPGRRPCSVEDER